MASNNVRKRRNGGPSSPGRAVVSGRPSSALNMVKNLTIFLTVVLLFVLVSLSYNNTLPWRMSHGTNMLDALATQLGMQEEVHAVVIDAGSTGTRVLAFTFHKSKIDGSLKLDKEMFKELKPGLSSYVKDPEAAGAPLRELLAAARQFVPAADVAHTPLILRATAGLRLLPEQRAEALLQTARAEAARSGFLVRPDAVAIMSGTDEGLFSWFTVNFLLDRLGGDPGRSVAVFDLGGGSTQVTFAPAEAGTVQHAPAGSIVDVSAMKADVGVYTQSYLGVGLMAARHSLLTAGLPREQRSVVSDCVNPIVATTWSYAGKTYNISGVETKKNYKFVKGISGLLDKTEPIVDFVQCYQSAVRFLSGQVHAPEELRNREVYAISYYFDRATEAGLIDPFDGGVVTVEQLMRAARHVCETANVEQPLACLDLAYIAALLHAGLGLPGDHRLQLHKKIDDHETSWALGAAFHTLTNRS
ncbi:ectonucleoside triphosphate diphosphohydrolase 5-like isoform X2 [Pollicipes pollicipes]|uniref:ectonucleoside triphosphate diphosphohydrolase 5-like isoform X2 n=1 Tax=Pollicipes pollicipes TaxID=41117 RepID=UPI00188570F7|nr:ectonucleoside triphosphate diphosphohydrolase 5-like isoform X2 [Pollicipes pollicipes]